MNAITLLAFSSSLSYSISLSKIVAYYPFFYSWRKLVRFCFDMTKAFTFKTLYSLSFVQILSIFDSVLGFKASWVVMSFLLHNSHDIIPRTLVKSSHYFAKPFRWKSNRAGQIFTNVFYFLHLVLLHISFLNATHFLFFLTLSQMSISKFSNKPTSPSTLMYKQKCWIPLMYAQEGVINLRWI